KLRTQVFPPQPISKYTVSAPLYGTSYCELRVSNLFEKDSALNIKLNMVKDSKDHELPPGFTSVYSLSQTSAANPNTASQGSLTGVNPPIPVTKGQTAGQAAAAQQIAAQTAQSALIVQNVPSGLNVAENVDFLPFRLNSTQLSLQTGSTGTIQVRFTPITLGTQQCRVLFIDNEQGEFAMDIEGVGTMPQTLDVFSVSAMADSTQTHELAMPTKNRFLDALRSENPQLDKAMNTAMQQITGGFSSSDPLNYKVELSSPFFTAPKDFSIVMDATMDMKRNASLQTPTQLNPSSIGLDNQSKKPEAVSGSSNIGGAGASGAQGSSLNSGLYQGAIGTARFPVTFHPKGPGEYPCRIILRSPLDLRVFDLKGVAQSPGL
ncbi:MAG: hypothetical protein EZS28_049215, partial [Streblomastix strix]